MGTRPNPAPRPPDPKPQRHLTQIRHPQEMGTVYVDRYAQPYGNRYDSLGRQERYNSGGGDGYSYRSGPSGSSSGYVQHYPHETIQPAPAPGGAAAPPGGK